MGVFLASFCIHNLPALCFTYGIMFGGGASLVYTPSLAIIGHYFRWVFNREIKSRVV